MRTRYLEVIAIAIFVVIFAVVGCSNPKQQADSDAQESESSGSTDTGPEETGPEETGPEETAGGEEEPKGETENPSEGAVALLEVTPISRANFDEFVAANSGKVVVFDFWATWCVPCREGFPHTTQLANKYADADVLIASLSFDLPGSEAKAAKFVTEQNADAMKHFMIDAGLSESFAAYDIKGGIPEYRIFDKSGKQRYVFRPNPEGDVEPVENLEIRIRELLDE
jgi:thiol-disulfide isomerase/thioredoxin